MPTILILSAIANVLKMVRRKKKTSNTFWVFKHIQSRSFMLNNWQKSRMYRLKNFVQNHFSNTTQTSTFSSFYLTTCYFAVSYLNGKYVILYEI